MTDGPVRMPAGKPGPVSQPVRILAERVMSVLAKSRLPTEADRLQPDLSNAYDALLADASMWRTEAMRLLTSSEISSAQIIDECVPALARKLGARWCDDSLGFAEVSIGSARLQALVRDANQRLPENGTDTDAASIAVVVRDIEQHTLGASVLTSQLRRRGYSVRLMIGQPDRVLHDALGRRPPGAVFVSSASSETLGELKGFVETCREAVTSRCRIIVGGPVLELSENVQSFTGADVATSDVEEAIRTCGLELVQTSKSEREFGSAHG